jgi:hypothetical protein
LRSLSARAALGAIADQHVVSLNVLKFWVLNYFDHWASFYRIYCRLATVPSYSHDALFL